MADIIFHAHSGVRYLVLLAGVIALVYTLVNMLRSRPWDRRGQVLLGTFIGVLDLQFILGVVLLILWPFYPALIGHIVLMLLAVAVAHGASVVHKRRTPERQSHVLPLLGIAGPLLLIIAGIMAIQRSII